MIYTVTLNPSLDYVMDVPALHMGITNRSVGQCLYPGGKGINVSVVLHRLGQPTVATGLIAGFTGEELKRRVEQMGISTFWLPLQNGMSRINVKIRGGQETEINGAGPMVTGEEWKTLCDMAKGISKEDILVLSGSLSSGVPADGYYQLTKLATEQGAKVVVDATGNTLKTALQAKPFLVKPNRQELGEYFGCMIDTNDLLGIARLALKLQEEGAVNVLVSLGSKGCLLLDQQGKVHTMPAAVGKTVNTVGAGDSMIAGFLTGYLVEGDYSYALRLATACGGATAFSEGLADADTVSKVLATLPTETVCML